MTRPLPDQSLGPEWMILELLARGIASSSEEALIRERLTSENLSWGELIEQALRHKMLPMLAYQVTSADLRFEVPVPIYQHLESVLTWNRRQIEVFRREAVRVARALAAERIPFVVTKGISFESTVYGGLGTRYMNDIDCMIAPADRDAAMKILEGIGYRPFFEWAKDARREEISARLNPDHLPKIACEVDEPGTRMVNLDVANSLTWHRSPFDVPVEEALQDPIIQPVPGIPGASLQVFQPIYQFLFTALHLFREAWLQKFVDFGNDVGLMKFGDVVRLVDQDRATLTDGKLFEIMESHNVTHPVAWVLRSLDDTFQTRTVELLGLENYGDEEVLSGLMSSKAYVGTWSQSMRERLQSKNRGADQQAATAQSAS